MVRLSLFVALTAILAIAINVQAIQINTSIDINARHQTSENHDILEPRMNNVLNNAAAKLAQGVGKASKVTGELGKHTVKTFKEEAPYIPYFHSTTILNTNSLPYRKEAFSRTVNSLIHGGTTLAQSGL